ncbi:MAG: hypothetical protein HKN29_06360 [Rhodothermales bacterium]|nr:hypothetical protein [Rhodothermales bacterium]
MRSVPVSCLTLALLLFSGVLAGCGANSSAQVASHLSGRLMISAEVDSLADYSGFEVVVVSNLEGDIDTLAVAETDMEGRFETGVRATERGIYPLVISRGGQTLTIEEIVIAADDSVRMTATFPLDGRPVRLVSVENAAWSAYKNTKAQYNRGVLDLVQNNPEYTEQEMGNAVAQASGILWSLQQTFPDTFGSLVANAEAVVMLEGWNDSLAVARAREIAATHPSKVDIIRAIRRSVARLEGQDAAVAFLRSYLDGGADDPEILSEVVVARMDSLQQAEAVLVAREIQAEYPDSEWAGWAEGAIYESENLLPGMSAPAFSVIDTEGEVIDNQTLADQFYMLEFYTPTHPLFLEELGQRQAVLNALADEVFEAISISVDPDSAYNEALLDGRDFQGRFVFEPEGQESAVAVAYNVNLIPTRILVDPNGLIVGKYVGAAFNQLENDLAARLRALSGR